MMGNVPCRTRLRLPRSRRILGVLGCLLAVHLLSACQLASVAGQSADQAAALPEVTAPVENTADISTILPTPFPTRPLYQPGELVDYVAQTGDTLPQLAGRFNTSVEEILAANPFIPSDATTMPSGMPMKIPIYYLPLWGSPYQILPDSLFVNGPAAVGFNTSQYVAGYPGWLGSYSEYAADATRSGGEIVDYIAQKYSVSPRLLLALLEYQSGALSQPDPSQETLDYPLGVRSWDYRGLYLQLAWAANRLNNGYYSYRSGKQLSLQTQDGREQRFDPWQNAATIALHIYFNTIYVPDEFARAISPDGFIQTYRKYFGDPWLNPQTHLPGNLQQPDLGLPFIGQEIWAYTGGPHTAWGTGEPYAALDFAPPAVAGGCRPTDLWATALADGLVVRSETDGVVIDLDGDGDERTGWNIFYLHLAADGRVPAGFTVHRGDKVGHPSCEGGTSTGTHVHVARKYNGEWMLAEGIDGVLAFVMEGWLPQNGEKPYEGKLTRNGQEVSACTCSNQRSFIRSDSP